MRRVSVSLPDHVFDIVEEAREREPRSAFVARVLEAALSPPTMSDVGVRNESDDAMVPSSPVVALAGSNPAPPPNDREPELPKIAPRRWGQ